ncbi:MAG: glycine-rich domain-containing protein [Acidaminococcaceae bacterium]
MPSDYRYDPFNNIAEPIAITGETHIIPSNSPYTIRLAEVPVKESPSTVSLTIAGVAGTEVAAEPAAGEFRCDYTTNADSDENWNTGLIQFNAADAGKTVVVNYNGMGSLASVDFHRSQLFKTSGTFNVPKGITKVYLSGCGAGAGGYRGYSVSVGEDTSDYKRGGGGAGASVYREEITVTPGQEITVTIGAAGAAEKAGGATSFGALLTLPGGGAATVGNAGASGGQNSSNGGYADGGSSLFGTGGVGPQNPGNGNQGSGYGSGGSSGYGGGSNGAAGRPGMLLVEW